MKLDTTVVRVAKIKNNETIGKVRYATRGYRDQTELSRFYSTAPTVSAISVRIFEILGMRLRLSSFLLDVSDAFYCGEYLNPSDPQQWLWKPNETLGRSTVEG